MDHTLCNREFLTSGKFACDAHIVSRFLLTVEIVKGGRLRPMAGAPNVQSAMEGLGASPATSFRKEPPVMMARHWTEHMSSRSERPLATWEWSTRWRCVATQSFGEKLVCCRTER